MILSERLLSLPKINQLVNSTSGHAQMSFLDAYQGNHQIPIHEPDQEKIAFITSHRILYYKIIPFGLKNARATYQCMIMNMFKPLMGKIKDGYIDDMVVRSKRGLDHLKDLVKVFAILKEHNLRLKAAKCAFAHKLRKIPRTLDNLVRN